MFNKSDGRLVDTWVEREKARRRRPVTSQMNASKLCRLFKSNVLLLLRASGGRVGGPRVGEIGGRGRESGLEHRLAYVPAAV